MSIVFSFRNPFYDEGFFNFVLFSIGNFPCGGLNIMVCNIEIRIEGRVFFLPNFFWRNEDE